MAFYGKVFVFEREENFGEFVNALGLPEEKAQRLLQYKPKQKIEKNGDEYTFTIMTDVGAKITKFKSGQEFDDTIRDAKMKVTVTTDGNKATQIIKLESGVVITIKKEYADNSFSEEASHSKWDGVARRYYKAE